jgi:hypothetical protein
LSSEVESLRQGQAEYIKALESQKEEEARRIKDELASREQMLAQERALLEGQRHEMYQQVHLYVRISTYSNPSLFLLDSA